MKLEVNIISRVTKVGVANNGYLNKDVFAIHKDVWDLDVDVNKDMDSWWD